MSSDQYTPSEEHVRDRYVSYETLDFPGPEPDAEFDRFLTRVRRDAERSALKGLATHLDDPGRKWGVIGPSGVRLYIAEHHPEEAT